VVLAVRLRVVVRQLDPISVDLVDDADVFTV
jgi:hypothetical protein